MQHKDTYKQDHASNNANSKNNKAEAEVRKLFNLLGSLRGDR